LAVAVTLAAAAISADFLVAVLAAAFVQRRLSTVVAHVLVAEVSADQVAHRASTTAMRGSLPSGRTDSLR
jgi:hypothetical protein